MTFCGIYIGDADDPKFEPDRYFIGNQPRSISPPFPPSSHHYNQDFHDWCALRSIEKVETDMAVYVAMVSKGQIVDYLEQVYDKIESYKNPAKMMMWEGRPYLVEKLKKVEEAVSALDSRKRYALVAYCD